MQNMLVFTIPVLNTENSFCPTIISHHNKFYPPISSQWGIFYLHRHMAILFMRDSLYASQGSPFTLNIALRIKQNFILCNQSQKTTI